MIKSIKVYQAEALINQRDVDGLFYVDKVSHEDYSEIIFKSDLSNQLYSFYYCDDSDLGRITIDTTEQFDAFLYDGDNDNLDVEVAPVKKVTKQISVTKYIGDD